MDRAVIVDALRTPIGRRGGALKDVHPVDLAAFALKELLKKTDLKPSEVEDVILGCVTQTAE